MWDILSHFCKSHVSVAARGRKQSLHCLFNRYIKEPHSKLQMLEGPSPLAPHSLACTHTVLSKGENESLVLHISQWFT